MLQVNASNVREFNISDNDEEVLDKMLDGAEAVDEASVDPLLSAEQQANLTRLALKRKIEEAANVDVISKDLPPKLRIKPDDPEDVVRETYFDVHISSDVVNVFHVNFLKVLCKSSYLVHRIC